eukprot:3087171-Pyramimonas_sp.AAC.1
MLSPCGVRRCEVLGLRLGFLRLDSASPDRIPSPHGVLGLRLVRLDFASPETPNSKQMPRQDLR